MQSMYNCPSCQAPVAYGQDFCRNCGVVLTWGTPSLYYCPACAAAVTYGRATCGSCGAQLTWDNIQTSQTAEGQSQAESGQATKGSQTTTVQKKPASQFFKNIVRRLQEWIKKRPAVAVTGLLLIVLVTGAVIAGINWANQTSSGRPGGTATPPAELAIVSFTAGPATIAPGESTTLQWNTSGAKSVTIDHGIGKVAISGSLAVSPSANTTYTLTAEDVTGSITRSTTVKVVPATIPVISSFTSMPSTIQGGQSSTLQWDVTGARTISIDHGVGTVPASGSTAVTPSENTTYTLTATSPAGSRTATTAVTVSGISLPVITSFLASPPLIHPGQTSHLQWDIKGAKSASIDHGVGTVALNGSTPVSPSDNTTYTLTATNMAGSTTSKALVSLTQSLPPVINSFTATPDTISPGQSSTLQWSVRHGSILNIAGRLNWRGASHRHIPGLTDRKRDLHAYCIKWKYHSRSIGHCGCCDFPRPRNYLIHSGAGCYIYRELGRTPLECYRCNISIHRAGDWTG